MNRFERALESRKPLLIDGGLATELEAQGHDISTHLWSAALLRSAPDAIVAAHLAYLEAGARCIISASYQASRRGLTALGIDMAEADRLIAHSVELAVQARERFLAAHPDVECPPLVAASVGPYGATLHDGSEYTGGYAIETSALADFHRERLAVLDAAGADLLACETIPSMDEARVLAGLLREARTPAWVSFSCRDARHISDGTPLAEVAALFRGHPRVLALGINCTPPQFVVSLIREIRSHAPDRAVVVYPNSGETFEAATKTWHGTVSPLECAGAAQRWLEAGARLVGGCCRMGPEHIRAIGRSLHGPRDADR